MSESKNIIIARDIQLAHTLPAEIYRNPTYFDHQKESIFSCHWHFLTDTHHLHQPGQMIPFTLLPDCLNEPLVLTCDMNQKYHCLSNVCTHRGNILIGHECKARQIRCGYHGRRFQLNGQFAFMPEFENVPNFPSDADNLPHIPMGQWGPFLFASLTPSIRFQELIQPLHDRLFWVPFETFSFDPTSSREYIVNANWALYCDNYLEGFHIPYVHPSLADVLDYASYQTELYHYASLQLGLATEEDYCFDIPANAPDHGKKIAAYYYWLFPTTMFNIYPWGLSLNVIQPLSVNRTRVIFLTYLWDSSKRHQGAGADLHRVEMEDEAIVENVQRGVHSRFYQRGRYSPTREKGVHHFHRLLLQFMLDSKTIKE